MGPCIARTGAVHLAPQASARLEALAARHPKVPEGIGRHPTVERAIRGRAHRPMSEPFGGTIASALPSPVHRATRDPRATAPAASSPEPPACAPPRRDPRAGLVTLPACVAAADGPPPLHRDRGEPVA